jgi:hypothetical protein
MLPKNQILLDKRVTPLEPDHELVVDEAVTGKTIKNYKNGEHI